MQMDGMATGKTMFLYKQVVKSIYMEREEKDTLCAPTWHLHRPWMLTSAW